MAGNYVDVPGHRMPYDRDGSVGFVVYSEGAAVQQLTQTEMTKWNDESNAQANTNSFGNQSVMYYGLIFPELRDIVGIFARHQWDFGDFGQRVDTSTNSTNGWDGSWTTRFTSEWIPTTQSVVPDYRTSILGVNYTGVKAIRFRHGGTGGASDSPTMRAFHVYGSIAAGQNNDRLRLWHPTLDQEVGGAYFDWGDVPRTSSADRTFRVKNNSAAFTANNITLSIQTLTDTTPTVSGQHTLSTDGTTFASTRTITSLAPGAISSIVTLRRITPSNATLSLWAARIAAVAASWS